jgi:hypothetical protein
MVADEKNGCFWLVSESERWFAFMMDVCLTIGTTANNAIALVSREGVDFNDVDVRHEFVAGW